MFAAIARLPVLPLPVPMVRAVPVGLCGMETAGEAKQERSAGDATFKNCKEEENSQFFFNSDFTWNTQWLGLGQDLSSLCLPERAT